jgi:hypothetical protein
MGLAFDQLTQFGRADKNACHESRTEGCGRSDVQSMI